MSNFFKKVKNSVKYWYVPLIVGIIFIAVGIYTFMSPLASYLALSLFFSLSFLFGGGAEIIFAISNRKELDNWGWTLTFGIFTFLVGLLLINRPEISIVTLPLYIGFLVLFRSIAAVSYAIDLKNYGIKDANNLLILGILGIVFSFLLLWNPVFAGMTIVFWTGLALVTSGVFSIYLAIKLKKIHDLPNKISDELKDRYDNLEEEMKEHLKR
ncbi:HdeD family acid-resistance protein [Flavobacterium agrisoli]|uniref:DUF308 domain-containing protein n=1 Tax=Flavobacterium agrisoli TaxID=2793066 RepID=A0A934PJJ1_9FLAO|nr:DUF308 domain-containing protein [Flavobacterium agrisoli]MBK0368767.1 DUF308 domain-containing protein [Flavobacterium agrisoli]